MDDVAVVDAATGGNEDCWNAFDMAVMCDGETAIDGLERRGQFRHSGTKGSVPKIEHALSVCNYKLRMSEGRGRRPQDASRLEI